MRRLLFLFALLALCAPLPAQTTPLDLMKQGLYGEARTLLDAQTWTPCYHLMYVGLTDVDAAAACSLYQVVAIRYPRSDCDSLARLRLRDARDAGFIVMPIAEWSRALPDVVPLFAEAPAGQMETVTKIESPVKIDTAVPLQPVKQMDWVSELKQTPPVAVSTPAAEPVSPPPPPPVKTATSAGSWFVQVGAFANFDNAHQLAKRLENAGYAVKLVPGGSEAKKLLQVRVGGYAQRAELNSVIDKLKSDYRLPTAVVKE